MSNVESIGQYRTPNRKAMTHVELLMTNGPCQMDNVNKRLKQYLYHRADAKWPFQRKDD